MTLPPNPYPTPAEQVHRAYVISTGVRTLLTTQSTTSQTLGKWMGALKENLEAICDDAALQHRLVEGTLVDVVADPEEIRREILAEALVATDSINLHYARIMLTARMMDLGLLSHDEVEALVHLGLTQIALEMLGREEFFRADQEELARASSSTCWIATELGKVWQEE